MIGKTNTGGGVNIDFVTAGADQILDGYTGVDVDGNPVPGDIVSRGSADVTVSGDTVSFPSGYYHDQQTKSVGSGTEGKPSATKGTVSNNQVSVTPSVTNSAGYISGGTKSGDAVTVKASELVSGTLEKAANGEYDCTNYAKFKVNIPTFSW